MWPAIGSWAQRVVSSPDTAGGDDPVALAVVMPARARAPPGSVQAGAVPKNRNVLRAVTLQACPVPQDRARPSLPARLLPLLAQTRVPLSSVHGGISAIHFAFLPEARQLRAAQSDDSVSVPPEIP